MKKNFTLPIGFLILSLALWQGLASMGYLDAQLVPSPFKILTSINQDRSLYLSAFAESFTAAVCGWILSVGLGSVIAFSFSLLPSLRKAIYPFAIFFQTVPIIAIAPLLVIYFGFGTPTVVASAFIVSIFPVLANTLVGLESYSQAQLDLFKVYRANSTQILWQLKVPSAFSQWFTGLKISAGLAVIGTVAGEFVAGGGLGSVIDSARTQQRIEMVFAALGLLSLMALILFLVIESVRLLMLSYRPYIEKDLTSR